MEVAEISGTSGENEKVSHRWQLPEIWELLSLIVEKNPFSISWGMKMDVWTTISDALKSKTLYASDGTSYKVNKRDRACKSKAIELLSSADEDIELLTRGRDPTEKDRFRILVHECRRLKSESDTSKSARNERELKEKESNNAARQIREAAMGRLFATSSLQSQSNTPQSQPTISSNSQPLEPESESTTPVNASPVITSVPPTNISQLALNTPRDTPTRKRRKSNLEDVTGQLFGKFDDMISEERGDSNLRLEEITLRKIEIEHKKSETDAKLVLERENLEIRNKELELRKLELDNQRNAMLITMQQMESMKTQQERQMEMITSQQTIFIDMMKSFLSNNNNSKSI